MKKNLYGTMMILSLFIFGQSCGFQPKTIKLPSDKYYLQEEKGTGIVKLHDNRGSYPGQGNIIGFMVSADYFYGWYNGKSAPIYFIVGFENDIILEFSSLFLFENKLEALGVAKLNMNDEITFAGIFGSDEKKCKQTLLQNELTIVKKGRNCIQIKTDAVRNP